MKPVNRPENKQTGSQEARRKIIKGIAGLPAVYTLSSGAHAATASALDCLANPPAVPPANKPSPSTGGSLVRNCEDSPPAIQYPGHPDLYYTVPDDAARLLNNSTATGENPTTGKGQYCVVYVDSNTGVPVTFDNNVSGTTAVYASCYASIVVSDKLHF